MYGYKKIALLASLLMTYLTGFSQTNDTIIINNGAFQNPEFQKVFSIEITKAYMLDYKSLNELTEAQKEGIDQFFNVNDEGVNLDSFVETYGLILINNDWESAQGVLNKSFHLINDYVDSSFLNKSAVNVCETVGEARDSKFSLMSNSASSYIVDIEDVKTKKEKTDEVKVVGIEHSSNFVWVYWVLIGLCIIAILILFKINFDLQNKLLKEEKKHVAEVKRLNRKHKETDSKKDNKLIELQNLNTQLKDNKQSLGAAALKAKIENQEVKKQDKKEFETPVSHILNEPKQSSIFLPSPKAECKFNAEEGSSFIKDRSLYVIVLEGDSNRGLLSIADNREMYEVAFNSPDIYLEKACEFENAYERHHKSISTITKGTVIKNGLDWVVEKKVLIKFV